MTAYSSPGAEAYLAKFKDRMSEADWQRWGDLGRLASNLSAGTDIHAVHDRMLQELADRDQMIDWQTFGAELLKRSGLTNEARPSSSSEGDAA